MIQFKSRLRKLVRQIFPKKKVIRMIKLRKEASNRDFYRIFLNSGKTCIAMVFQKDEEVDDSSVDKIFDATSVFQAYKINTPLIYRYFPDDKIIIQKDAGSLSLEAFSKRSGKKNYVNIYKQVIDALLKIRYQPLPSQFQNKTPFICKFTYQKFFNELSFFLRNSELEKKLSNDQLSSIKIIFEKISEDLSHQDYILTHRDLHSRNILIHNNTFSLVDHQDARMGPYLYDLTSLLKDSYMNLSHKIETELISYYLEMSEKTWQKPVHHESFFYCFYQCMFQRSLKAAGTFFYQVNVKNNLKYQKYIPVVLKYVLIASDRLRLNEKEIRIIEQMIQSLL